MFQMFFVSKNSMDRRVGGREHHDIPSEFFLSHSAEKFRRGIFQCFTDFGYGNFLWITRVGHDFLSKVYFSHSIRKLRIETLLCFRNFPVLKNLKYEKSVVGGVSRYSVRNFLWRSAQKARR